MSDPNWRTIPPLSSLRAFDLTSRGGNFAEAARALNVTHAAIAQQVRALEGHLGIALVRREGRTVNLTSDGARLAECLNQGFDIISDGITVIQNEQVEKPIQITVTPFIGQSVVMPRLPDFWRKHPDIHVSMMPSQDVVDFVQLGFDLAIRATPDTPNWPGLNAEFLFESPMVAVGSPALVAKYDDDLSGAKWIWKRGTTFEENRLRAFGLEPDQLENVALGSQYLDVPAAIGGLGMIALPEILVSQELAFGQLSKASAPSPYSIAYYSVTAKGQVSSKARRFIDWLKTAVEDVV